MSPDCKLHNRPADRTYSRRSLIMRYELFVGVLINKMVSLNAAIKRWTRRSERCWLVLVCQWNSGLMRLDIFCASRIQRYHDKTPRNPLTRDYMVRRAPLDLANQARWVIHYSYYSYRPSSALLSFYYVYHTTPIVVALELSRLMPYSLYCEYHCRVSFLIFKWVYWLCLSNPNPLPVAFLLICMHAQIKLPSDSISRQVKLWLVFYCYSLVL